jgi:hypothetical protein
MVTRCVKPCFHSHVGIGIGGGIGPLRMGVSTRGIGGRVGPISAGTSWRRGRGGGGGAGVFGMLLGAAIVVTVVYLAFAWPWIAARSIARAHDFSPHAQHVIAWIVEAIYILAILLFAASTGRGLRLLGVSALGTAFLVTAVLHGHYDAKAAAAEEAKATCTPAIAATVQKARDLVVKAHRIRPREMSDREIDTVVVRVYGRLSDQQDRLDKSNPLYQDIDGFLAAWNNQVPHHPNGVTPRMTHLLADCGVHR